MPKMALNTSSWSVKEGVNKTKLKLEVPNFSDVVGDTRKGQRIKSKQFDVGGSKFALKIYPNGSGDAEEGMLSAFLLNASNHDVVVDCTISVEGGREDSWENAKIEKGRKSGRRNFMRASEIGTDLETTVEVELKWEDISGGVVEKDQVDSKNLVQVEERLGGKLEQMGGKLEHMGGKLEEMKTFVLAELNQQQQEMKKGNKVDTDVYLHKVPVTKDPNAEKLARLLAPQVVISASALCCLMDNHVHLNYSRSWIIPVTIRSYNCQGSAVQKKVIFFGKPLPPRTVTNADLSKISSKAALASTVSYTHLRAHET